MKLVRGRVKKTSFLLLVLLLAAIPVASEKVEDKTKVAVFFSNGIKLPPSSDNALFAVIIVEALASRKIATIPPATLLELLDEKKNDKKPYTGEAETQKILKAIRKTHPHCVLLLLASVTNVSFKKIKDGDDDPLLPVARYALIVEYSFSTIDVQNGKCIDRIRGSKKAEGFLSEKDNTARDREALRLSLLQEALAKAGLTVATAVQGALREPIQLRIEEVNDGDIKAIVVSGNPADVKVGSEFDIFEEAKDKDATKEVNKGTAIVVKVVNDKIFLKVVRGIAKTGYIMRERGK